MLEGFGFSLSNNSAKALELKGVLEFLISKGMYNVGIELDAKIAVDGVHGLLKGVVFEDCRNLLQRGLKFSLSHVSTNENKAAHVLSRHAATVSQFICWSQSAVLLYQVLSSDV